MSVLISISGDFLSFVNLYLLLYYFSQLYLHNYVSARNWRNKNNKKKQNKFLENKSGGIFLRSTSLLYKFLPTNLGVCKPPNSRYYFTQSKQLSRRCINFPHELTCQSLTSQSIKIGRTAWPTRDHGKERSSPPVFLKKLAEFSRARSVWNRNINSAGPLWHIHNIFHMNHWKK